MRTSNPALNRGFGEQARTLSGDGAMTIGGTINKTGVLVLLAIFSAYWMWTNLVGTDQMGDTALNPSVMPWMWGGLIGGLIVALIIIFKQTLAPVLSPVYALLEGLVIGGLSGIMEMQYPGIVFQAAIGTFGTLFGMLFLYRTGVIKVTDKFRSVLMMATFGIMMVYLVGFIMSFFGSGIPMIHESGPIGIGFSLLVCGIAALNLLLDFDLIEKGAARGAPKHMEWFGAFALLVTLIWLYIEILRLLSKLRSR